MEIGTISNIYLLIFLPLFASLTCQIFQIKNFCFSISLLTVIAVFGLLVKVFPDVLIYEKIKNDYDLSLLSIALEFSLDLIGIVFLVVIIFLEAVILIFYRTDILKILNQRNQSNFYSVFLLNLFSLVGILTTNNLFNLYLFIEIHSFSFFAITTISHNKKLLDISFKNFCLSAVSSILILICFFAIYLTFSELNFDKIADNIFLMPASKIWFILMILLLFSLALIVKFFPLWQYFEKIKSTSLVASFLIIDAFFIKILVGLFLAIKFIYFFFGYNFLFSQYQFSPIMILTGFGLVLYSSFKLFKEHHLKLICIFFSISNIGFMISALGMQSVESIQSLFFFLINFSLINFFIFFFSISNIGFMISALGMQSVESIQSLFFFLINFSLINFFIFLFASFMKKNCQTSSINRIFKIAFASELSSIPFKLIVPFIAALPFTFLFFGYWYMALASMELNLKIIMIIGLIFSNFVQLNIAMKIIDSIIKNNNISKSNLSEYSTSKDYFQILCFWIMALTVFTTALLSESINDMSLRFASFLLANTI
ncbi:MAG: hypothetical protein FJX30_02285 [Alphaproteobacteria bacterium]|nr:hypothetical protein [Alphaproteobacteria bacterium]